MMSQSLKKPSSRKSVSTGQPCAAALGNWKGRLFAALSPLLMLGLTGCEQLERDILDPISESGRISAMFYNNLLLLCGVIFLIVASVFVYALVRFRARPGDNRVPKQNHGNTKLEIMWTIAPTLIVIGITIPTLQGIFELEAGPAEGEEVVRVNVIGKQWWWEYDYVDPADPSNVYFSVGNEIHVEEGTWVHLSLTSADVIHAWWVPNIAGKRDATPGREYPLYFKPEKSGVYIGQCAELCGASHALMGIKVFVHPKEGSNSYDSWVEQQQATALAPTTMDAEEGRKLFVEKSCNRCHLIRGSGLTETEIVSYRNRVRTSGPELTHVGSRTSIAALALDNTRENLAHWIEKPGEVKQFAIMADPRYNTVKVSKEEAEKIAAYLFRLK
jgi:cytochrome c oxidase subunit 2